MQATTYARLKSLAATKGVSVTAMLEAWIIKQLDTAGVAKITDAEIKPRTPRKAPPREPKHTPPDEDGVGGIFTF